MLLAGLRRARREALGEITAAPQLIWRREMQTFAVLELAALLRAWKPEED